MPKGRSFISFEFCEKLQGFILSMKGYVYPSLVNLFYVILCLTEKKNVCFHLIVLKCLGSCWFSRVKFYRYTLVGCDGCPLMGSHRCGLVGFYQRPFWDSIESAIQIFSAM